jgi:hypothetical protein
LKKAAFGGAFLVVLGIGVAVHPSLRGSEGSSSPELRVIDAKKLPSFKADFNEDGEAIRIVLLLSPT